jgi:hypothetical protein
MPDYDDTNRFVLFAETEKKNPKGPDYTGELDIDGKKYRIAGWKKTAKSSGKTFLAGDVEAMDDRRQKQGGTASGGHRPMTAEDIPF